MEVLKIKRSALENAMNVCCACDIDVAPVRMDGGTLYIRSISPDRTRFIDMEIFPESGTKFDLVGIPTDTFRDVLANMKQNEMIEMIMKDSYVDLKGGTKKFSIRLINVEKTEQKVSEFNPDVVLNISAKDLKDVISSVLVFKGNEIHLTTDDKGLKIHSTDDSNVGEVVIEDCTKNGDVDISFSSLILKGLINALEGDLTLSLKNDYPLIVETQSKWMNMKAYVAPRVNP